MELVAIRVKEIMQYEISGLSKTICEYSTDNYIISYAKQLVDCKYPDDMMSIKYLVRHILEWYEQEISIIEKNNYVYGVRNHEKSIMLLRELRRCLEEER